MQTSNAKLNFKSDDPIWILLTELSLGDFLLDYDRKDDPTASFLFQTVQEFGMSPECTEGIARTLAGFATETSVRYKEGGLKFLGRIRIFCQKQMIDAAKSANMSRPSHTEPDKKQQQIVPDSRPNMIGGWGYFIIERGEDLLPYSSAIAHNSIDLYLYKEGG